MSLKIKKEDLEFLKGKIKPIDTQENREKYLRGDFSNSDRCKDLNKRYRWDLLYSSRISIGDGVGTQGDLNLYAYLNDEHIDSALKSFIPTL